ncbi:tail fiber protein [Xenorhabdus budapestensis]|uniref:phage tail fiber protein n=1 Tax=Xenorhabdus budapestensis TaxID=290110 RepID=UPI003A8C4BDA
MSIQNNKPDTPISESEDSDFVIVPTRKYVKESIEEHAQSRNHPDATLEDKGFVILSNDVDSDSQLRAATSRAVKKAYDLANTANQNAINANNNNSNTYLEKKQNGADIPNKTEFVNNLGLTETVILARNAVSSNGGSYQGYFKFAQVGTSSKENNSVTLISTDGASNTPVSFTNYEWYKNNVQTGIIRGNDTNMLGYAININNTRVMTLSEGGDLTIRGSATIKGNFKIGGNLIIGGNVTVGGFKITNDIDSGISATHSNDTLGEIEDTIGNSDFLINFIDKKPDGSIRSVQSLLKGDGVVMSTSHYQLDPNGFVKKTSPIINIWNDGKFETNKESHGAVVEHISEGIYHIKGIPGINIDMEYGGIEIPLCKNKLPLIWVDHETLPDGSIKLMTYHREHSDVPTFARNTQEGYADGDLIDIPNGRFISVRVQMPSAKD